MSTPRTVLVTGGNRGIGRAIAEEFIRQGHRVAVTVRSGEGPAGALSVVADVTDSSSLDSAFAEVAKKLGPIEVLRQAQIDASFTFNYTPYVAAACLFIALTIPMTRFTDWLQERQRRQRGSGFASRSGSP